MKLPFSQPDPAGSERAKKSKFVRDLATEVSRLRPQALTRTNNEEADHGPTFPANFTKGLKHNAHGLLADPSHYRDFVEAINSTDSTLFEKHVQGAGDCGVEYACLPLGKDLEPELDKKGKIKKAKWRGWESPRAGHVYELQGPDAGAVGMAPAPRVGSSELAVEMAEVYGLALLRDVPFTEICTGGGTKKCASDPDAGEAELDAATIVDLIGQMSFFDGNGIVSSTACTTGEDGLNQFERNRRSARLIAGPLTPATAFRGSTPGAMVGPYISQFMLIGANSLNCETAMSGRSNYPGTDSAFDFRDGYIPYGSLIIDQRTLTQKNCLDYMTEWCSWLDVQNGANFKGLDVFEDERRFITTPRDLATYVHFDALYEAYLNAGLIMLGMGVPASKGFPEPSPSERRDAFATFGGPHILSLVTEVATRCLKAVRRQKFNYHRRARPETLAGRLALVCALSENGDKTDELEHKLGCATDAFVHTLNEIPAQLRDAVVAHNAKQNTDAMAAMRRLDCPDPAECVGDKAHAEKLAGDCNLLLPMAFPEGSPMHPAYGAGHATVAGGCVTMLKAFFEMFEDCDSSIERPLAAKDDDGNQVPIVYVPNEHGTALKKDDKFGGTLTIQGELDKLAANISIGRNMAGVHYYSDYYDSLRMGERIAVGILLEQAPTYGDAMETSFKSFDGDLITISGEADSCPSLSVIDADGVPVSPDAWWLRHVSGQELSEDL